MRLKSLAMTIVHTLLFFVHTQTVLVAKHLENTCPHMESLVTAMLGPMISASVAAQCIMVDGTSSLLALVKHTAVAIFKEATALDSGVSGMVVMVQFLCLEEEEVDAVERIMVSGSLRMTPEDFKNGLMKGRLILEMKPTTTARLLLLMP